ncbi:DNA-binding domain-containing protein [soil metagenome]
MLQHKSFQTSFAASILDANAVIPAVVVGGTDTNGRFGVYRNNVVKSLCDALSDTFPVVRQIVGDEFFAAMAREFVLAQPPTSPVLLEYGEGFADFLSLFPPVDTLPYLADVARIERAWLDVYHAAEPDGAARFAMDTVDLETMPHMALCLHPALRLVRCRNTAFGIWHAHAAEDGLHDLSWGQEPQDLLIIRPQQIVEVHILLPGDVMFIEALLRGANILQAATVTFKTHVQFDVVSAIHKLFAAQAVLAAAPTESASHEIGQ